MHDAGDDPVQDQQENSPAEREHQMTTEPSDPADRRGQDARGADLAIAYFLAVAAGLSWLLIRVFRRVAPVVPAAADPEGIAR